jgi:outer membrane receptor for ferrienterochelin and colicins
MAVRWFFILIFGSTVTGFSQTVLLKGKVTHANQPVEFANIILLPTTLGTTTNQEGYYQFSNLSPGQYQLKVSSIGYQTLSKEIIIKNGEQIVNLELKEDEKQLQEVVITGTMKEVTKMNSPIPVEVYAPSLFIKNPTPNIFESLTMINGVQPQINCNVCNTGDIHINGLEGPYTMILIDGMPIVSSLATVYGLFGIPNSLVKRIEVVKGPGSTLYGSEAVAGVINIITQDPSTAPKLKVDLFGTSMGEYNVDVSSAFKVGRSSSSIGINYFNFTQKWDVNNDNFTDVTLQNRISVFNKWSIYRPSGKKFTVAGRYINEDRWGGELQWTEAYRGTDIYYGESIRTNRSELIGTYQLPTSENVQVDFSYNSHLQDSYYGLTKFAGNQQTTFLQMRWSKKVNQHDLLTGIPLRYTFYDDNTTGTAQADGANKPAVTFLPGVFVQDEINHSDKLTSLLGIRYDHHTVHGSIVTPRFSLKYAPDHNNTLRLTSGTGYRVVNLFTEEHAALSGFRQVEVKGDLQPERSWNLNLNYAKNMTFKNGFVNVDGSLFYTYFTNKIVGDFLTDPNKIFYDNLKGHAISKGITLNADVAFTNGLKLLIGSTWMDVFLVNEVGTKVPQLHAPGFSGTFALSYALPKSGWAFDLTGRTYGSMHLPTVPNDFRPSESPWFTIMNIQVTKPINKNLDVYFGIKNLLNFLPQNPLLRPFDPFDKNIAIDNPNGYTFDTSYNYAPIQGIRGMLGLRWTIR